MFHSWQSLPTLRNIPDQRITFPEEYQGREGNYAGTDEHEMNNFIVAMTQQYTMHLNQSRGDGTVH